jgi:acetyl esterase/lipase
MKPTSFTKWQAILLLLLCGSFCRAQVIVPLYTGTIPNAKGNQTEEPTSENRSMFRNVVRPTLEAYLPEKSIATGAAVIICPGGGYSVIVYQGEGVNTAMEFAKKGIAAFVLKYRLPSDERMIDKKIGPLQDAQQAVKLVRENAAQWGVDPNRIGIMGFSAGGHLASSEATHYQKALIDNPNNTSLRPDFQILVYPVISMQKGLTHQGSKDQLLGSNPTQEVVDLFSNEMQINPQSPPAYLTHAADDNTVDVDNSILYFEQLRKNKVPVEMHIYPKGNHGFVFGRKNWMQPLFEWMDASGYLTRK